MRSPIRSIKRSVSEEGVGVKVEVGVREEEDGVEIMGLFDGLGGDFCWATEADTLVAVARGGVDSAIGDPLIERPENSCCANFS